MTYFGIANSTMLWVLVGIALVFLVILAVLFFRKAWNRALSLGVEKEKLSTVVRSSALFSVVPSIAIIIGLFSLAAVMGAPWPTFRLSVVGSVSYELMAAEMVASGMGFSSVGDMAATGTYETFGTVMVVMSLGIIWGIVTNIFLTKKLQTSMASAKKRSDWGVIFSSCFFLALIVGFSPMIVTSGLVYLLTFICSILITYLFSVLVKKTKAQWLNSFTMAAAMLGSMVISVFLTKLIG